MYFYSLKLFVTFLLSLCDYNLAKIDKKTETAIFYPYKRLSLSHLALWYELCVFLLYGRYYRCFALYLPKNGAAMFYYWKKFVY